MIDSYSFGRITIDGTLYRSDVIIYPEGVQGDWWRERGHAFALQDLQEVLRYHPQLLIVGLGKLGRMKVEKQVVEEARRREIELVPVPTDAAVQEYNRRRAEGRVVAALHLTC
ncbi:MAG: hypothetical protein JW820_03770 [Spirochaetales bacterium]|nr:hypothetical protein [Spirochaetales bacterium]